MFQGWRAASWLRAPAAPAETPVQFPAAHGSSQASATPALGDLRPLLDSKSAKYAHGPHTNTLMETQTQNI